MAQVTSGIGSMMLISGWIIMTYNDITVTSLEWWLGRGIIPRWPYSGYFPLVNHYDSASNTMLETRVVSGSTLDRPWRKPATPIFCVNRQRNMHIEKTWLKHVSFHQFHHWSCQLLSLSRSANCWWICTTWWMLWWSHQRRSMEGRFRMGVVSPSQDIMPYHGLVPVQSMINTASAKFPSWQYFDIDLCSGPQV